MAASAWTAAACTHAAQLALPWVAPTLVQTNYFQAHADCVDVDVVTACMALALEDLAFVERLALKAEEDHSH